MTTTQTTPRILSASSIANDSVCNPQGEKLGDIKDVMIDVRSGRIAYAVLSFGGFLGIGDKLFAIPWSMLTVDASRKELILNVTKEQLEKAEGFDKDNWPDFADTSFHDRTHGYWKQSPSWR